MRDAIRLQKRKAELDESDLWLCGRIEKRLQVLKHDWFNKEAKRMVERLVCNQGEVFTFLCDLPFDNICAERSIRGAGIMRKNSFNNHSEKGAMTQSVSMSVFFTIKQRGLNPIDTVKKALEIYIRTGNLSKLEELTRHLDRVLPKN